MRMRVWYASATDYADACAVQLVSVSNGAMVVTTDHRDLQPVARRSAPPKASFTGVDFA